MLDQLNLLEVIDDPTFSILNSDVTEDVMLSISFKSQTNFLFIDPVINEYHYCVDIMDNGFDNTMVIHTSERDMFDYDYHLNIISNIDEDHVRIEERKMFHEYLLIYNSINSYKVSSNEKIYPLFNYNKDNNTFNNFPGTRYDAAIYTCYSSWMGLDAYTPINYGKPMILKEFVLYIMNMAYEEITIIILRLWKIRIHNHKNRQRWSNHNTRYYSRFIAQ